MKKHLCMLLTLGAFACQADDLSTEMRSSGGITATTIAAVLVDVKKLPDGRYSFQLIKKTINRSAPCDGSRWYGQAFLAVGAGALQSAIRIQGIPTPSYRYASCSADIWEVLSEGVTYVTSTNLTGYRVAGIGKTTSAPVSPNPYLTDVEPVRLPTPGAECDLSAAIIFDHETVQTSSSSSKSMAVSTECSIPASVTLNIQNNVLDFGGGTKSVLTLPNGQDRMSMTLPSGMSSFNVTSSLTTGPVSIGPVSRETILYLTFN
ncbi:hypothetical protein [Serratia marcescens]|uniref:hypothetical protein n=1 Tax=Serratia marcescens TaxID=615 RepID=UPI001057018B|nr:hypothetical protein [Serratia marcescens]